MEIDFSLLTRQIRAIIEGIVRTLPLIGVALIVFLIFFFISRGVRSLIRRLSARKKQHYNVGLVLGRLAQLAILFVGALVAVTIVFPSFKPGDLITLLGVSGVAVGFAFKDIFQNYLAGILILITEPFRVGDQIIVGDSEGTVEEIQTRATFIRTYDGRRVVIPNSDLYTDTVTVNTAFAIRRSEYDFGIGFGDDIARARELILETVRGTEGVLKDREPEVFVVELAESTVNLRARWWTNPQRKDVLYVQGRVLEAVKNRLTEEGIDLPFPTRQILFHDQTEETDGNRREQREGWPAGEGRVPRTARAVRLEMMASDGDERDAEPEARRA